MNNTEKVREILDRLRAGLNTEIDKDIAQAKKELNHHYAKEFLEMLPEEHEEYEYDNNKKRFVNRNPDEVRGCNKCLSDIKQTITKRYLEGE